MNIKKIKIRELDLVTASKLFAFARIELDNGLILKRIGLHRNWIKKENLTLTFPCRREGDALIRYFSAEEPFFSILKEAIKKELKKNKDERC